MSFESDQHDLGNVPAAQLIPPAAQLIPPAAQLVPPAAQLIPPAAQLVPPATQLVPPATQLVPPATQFVPPATQLGPPAAQLSPPAIQLGPPTVQPVPPARQISLPFAAGIDGFPQTAVGVERDHPIDLRVSPRFVRTRFMLRVEHVQYGLNMFNPYRLYPPSNQIHACSSACVEARTQYLLH
jgi:hypothetical protein